MKKWIVLSSFIILAMLAALFTGQSPQQHRYYNRL